MLLLCCCCCCCRCCCRCSFSSFKRLLLVVSTRPKLELEATPHHAPVAVMNIRLFPTVSRTAKPSFASTSRLAMFSSFRRWIGPARCQQRACVVAADTEKPWWQSLQCSLFLTHIHKAIGMHPEAYRQGSRGPLAGLQAMKAGGSSASHRIRVQHVVGTGTLPQADLDRSPKFVLTHARSEVKGHDNNAGSAQHSQSFVER